MADPLTRAEAEGWRVFRLGRKSAPFAVSREDAALPSETDVPADWYGIVTGRESGLTVLDIDNKKGHRGSENLSALIESSEAYFLPVTYTVRTPTGGYHLYFRYDGRVPQVQDTDLICEGVDTRNDGGVVAGAGTERPDGTYEVYRDEPLADVPEWLVDYVEDSRQQARHEEVGDEPYETPGTSWGKRVLEGEATRLAQAEDGRRNSTLFTCAQRVFGAVKGGHLDKANTRDTLLSIARGLDTDPEDPFTDEEIKKTLQSAWERCDPRGPDTEDRQSAEDVGRLRNLDDLDEIPPPKWLLQGVLPEGLTLVYGPEGAGKTFVVIDWTLALAQAGHTVVYCAGEGGSGLSLRTRAWRERHGPVKPERWCPAVFGDFPELARAGESERLSAKMRKLPESPDLVVLDTLSQTLRGASDTDDAAIREVFGAFRDWRTEFGASGIIIHHPKKASSHNPDPGYRGSGTIQMDSDMTWKVKPKGNMRGRLYNERAKAWEKQPSLAFSLVPVAGSCVVEPTFKKFTA